MRYKALALLTAFMVLVPSLLIAPGVMAAGVDTSTADRVIDEIWNGDNVIAMTEELCSISSKYPTYRVSGSQGADEAADLIAKQFSEYGLEVTEENFTMPVWNLTAEPTLTIDADGNAYTADDALSLGSFNCESFSKPTPSSGLIGELVNLPLPSADGPGDIGKKDIDRQAWDLLNITGKVLLIGREVRWSAGWDRVYREKLNEQPPAAIIYHYHYSWMSYAQESSQASSGGLPLGGSSPFFWDLGIVVGSVNYSDGQILLTASMEGGQVNMSVPSVISQGTHRNVVADIHYDGNLTKLVLMGAHYDTVLSEGYVDNSAGVAAVLETARTVQEAIDSGEFRPKYRMRFVAFAGEEMGMAGSLHYMSTHQNEIKDHAAVIIADSIGSSEMKVSAARSEWAIDLNYVADEACERLGISHSNQDLVGSDHSSFMYPYRLSNELNKVWGKDLNLNRGAPSTSAICVYSGPLTLYDAPGGPVQGRIHTALDSRQAVEEGNWIDQDDLRDQAQVFALMALYSSIGMYEPNYDYVPYVIALVAVTLVIAFFMFRRWRIEI